MGLALPLGKMKRFCWLDGGDDSGTAVEAYVVPLPLHLEVAKII